MKVYKIRNRKTGLFLGSGSFPGWTKQGRIWTKINHVTSSIRHGYGLKAGSEDCEIVEFELQEVGTREIK